jgi:hypothetical protein
VNRRDGSKWKSDFTKTNPLTNYIEVENYYTKALIGWIGNETRPLDFTDLEKAKTMLSKFDIILLSDEMRDYNHVEFLRKVFGTKIFNNSKFKNLVMGNQTLRSLWSSELNFDKVCGYDIILC